MDTPHASDPATSAIDSTCQGALHPQAVIGLECFNRREFFEAHEYLEAAWRDEKGPVRELYRGILQVGVAYLHIQRGNLRGALKMFRRLRPWLDSFPDECRGINLARLRQDYLAVERHLLEHGLIPESQQEAYFKPVEFKSEIP